ncbi:unnamed protein product [Eruca vesicaria subsp. sativa]|uniref:S-protein homolog n=1 Tax=Eruca vesicaria subsp. sativa TaxID=29727 RepID=A0ABC8M5V8_ERUVS|nr:unnamed protein product [Eruca vesicaria subsp. sativa]
MNILIIFMLIIAMLLGVSEAVFKCPKNQLIIRNELGPARSLQYHCRYFRNNEGAKFLKFKEQRIFEFAGGNSAAPGSRIIERIKVICVLRQGLWMENSSRDFEAYIGTDEHPCGQVHEWIARSDGVYSQRNRIKPAKLTFPWIKNPK